MGVTSRGVLVFRDVSEKKDILLIAGVLTVVVFVPYEEQSENAIGFRLAIVQRVVVKFPVWCELWSELIFDRPSSHQLMVGFSFRVTRVQVCVNGCQLWNPTGGHRPRKNALRGQIARTGDAFRYALSKSAVHLSHIWLQRVFSSQSS